MSTAPASWRSMLFLPAHVHRFIERAPERGADACVLDLEDSVPLEQKADARAGVPDAAAMLAARGLGVLVRVNADTWADDVRGVVGPAVRAVVLPKVDAADHVREVSRALDGWESAARLAPGHTRLLLQIEDVRALPLLDEIASASPRVLGMSLGSEDFSASAGMMPVPETLLLPTQLVAFACRRAGVMPYGFPASIAEYADLDALRRHLRLARQLGFVGALCVHPAQVAPINEAFSPTQAEIEEARGLVDAFETARRAGRAAVQFRGRMVDPPVVARALALLQRALPAASPMSQENP